MELVDAARRLRVLEDIEAIRALKARYFSCCDRKDPKGMRACFVDGPVHIDYGPMGVYADADAVVKLFTDVACHDYMVEMHHGSNPQIEVVNLTSARGTWSLHYALINTRDKSLTNLAGYYEDEYRRTETGWKISRTRFVGTSTVAMNYSEGVAKALFAGRPG